jgi:hypothetical protein
MEEYDPLKAPDAKAWLAMDESERLALIEIFHAEANIELPNELLHATTHCVVENQAALGVETPVRKTLFRLMREGVDRHEAIHAVGWVLMDHIHKIARGAPMPADANAPYFEALEKLTVKKWRKALG